MLDSCKMVEKQSEAFHTFLWHFFPNLKQNFIAYRSSKVSSRPDCIFEIHQLWQSGFSRVYSNSCCRCSFEPEIIKIGQTSYNIYSNNILNVQESMTIINAWTKKSGNLLKALRNYDKMNKIDRLVDTYWNKQLKPRNKTKQFEENTVSGYWFEKVTLENNPELIYINKQKIYLPSHG